MWKREINLRCACSPLRADTRQSTRDSTCEARSYNPSASGFTIEAVTNKTAASTVAPDGRARRKNRGKENSSGHALAVLHGRDGVARQRPKRVPAICIYIVSPARKPNYARPSSYQAATTISEKIIYRWTRANDCEFIDHLSNVVSFGSIIFLFILLPRRRFGEKKHFFEIFLLENYIFALLVFIVKIFLKEISFTGNGRFSG